MGLLTGAGEGVDVLWKNAVEQKTLVKDGVFQFAKKPSPIEIGVKSAKSAMTQAGWTDLKETDGIILGTTVGQSPLWENQIGSYLHGRVEANLLAEALKTLPLGHLLDNICQQLSFKGKTLLVTSACSASTQALGLAMEWIQSGAVNRCLVGGVEVLSKLTRRGFEALQLLSSDPCRPFDKQRSGINLSEAATFLCLEKNAKNSLAHISGYGFSTDAYHATSPQPEGAGSYRAMKEALEHAQLLPEDISWIHAHGTGSNANDYAEGVAISTLFGKTPVTSTKGVHGHALGASGALETSLCVLALQKQQILPTTGLTEKDSKIPISPASESTSLEIKHIMKNTLGFGGNNAALVLSRGNNS